MARIFTPEELSEQLAEIKRLRSKRRYSRSKLNRYLSDIFHLRFVEDASYPEICKWLQKNRRVKISPTGLRYFVQSHTKELEKQHG